jgi:molybdenum cofactor cytidylyltransferase
VAAGSDRVAGVILAAGASERLGQPKQLLRYRGETLIHRAARLAHEAALAPLHVVVGYRGGAVGGALGELGDAVAVVPNPDWSQGMGGSLARGIASLPATAEAALVLVTDQPHLSAALLGAILTTYRAGEASLVACRYAGGTVGVPALFARRHFRELTGLSGDRGARALFARHADTLATVSFPAGDTDVDTPAAAATLDPKQGPRLRGSPHV